MLVAPAEALYTHSLASAYSVARRSLLRRLGDQAGTSEEGERQAQPQSIRWQRVAVAAVLAFGIAVAVPNALVAISPSRTPATTA